MLCFAYPHQMVVSDGKVYGAISNLIFALDGQSGKQIWTTKVATGQVFNNMQVVDGTAYTTSNHVFVFPPDSLPDSAIVTCHLCL